MDGGPKKFYHEHNFDSRDHLKTYYSDKPDMEFADDCLKFPMMNFHYIFSSGFVKGDVLLDVSTGSLIHHLYPTCDVFKDIIILKLNEGCKMETSKWKNTCTGAFNWKHASSQAAMLDGKSAQVQDKDQQLKTAISHVMSCNFENENITHPEVLPLADCVTSLWVLGAISKDEDGYMRNMEKMSKLLRPGGHLILVVALNASYITIGGERFHIFKCDESFVKNALSKLGFVIDYCAVQTKRNDSKLTDYKAIMFITACKTK
ncbi:indolethylamine N-methyltransferase-like [Hyperolius riggenbachi]|uniref:indolethylamine N-methyltransferase-like n=1 Tax=Hyperolius riggenbachi TaxID=752182 RepID=UPI0035A3D586